VFGRTEMPNWIAMARTYCPRSSETGECRLLA
jgi:hypothetical protein